MSNTKFRDLSLFIVDIFVAVQKTKEYVKPLQTVNQYD
jgi:hypothetical protein